MGRARYLVEAVVVGGQSPNQLARSHGISRSWLFELLRRFREAATRLRSLAPGVLTPAPSRSGLQLRPPSSHFAKS